MMAILRMTVCAALVLAVGQGLCYAQDEDKISPEVIKKQAEKTLESAKKFTLQQKEEYQKKAEAELADLGKRIGELKDKAAEAKGDALTALEARIAELKGKQKAAEDRLKDLRASSAQAWQDMKTGLDGALNELRKTYDSVLKHFK